MQDRIGESQFAKGVTAKERYYGGLNSMTKDEAVSVLAEGHAFWKVEYVKDACKTLGIKFPKGLVETYNSQKEANPTNHYKGLFLNTDKFPVSGVASYQFSNYATSVLGAKGGDYFGRGTQARSNAEAVRKKLGL